MYPLNMQLPAPAVGFAVANDATEHQALSAVGYGPAYEAQIDARAALIAEAEAKGIKIDKRWSVERLAAEVSKG